MGVTDNTDNTQDGAEDRAPNTAAGDGGDERYQALLANARRWEGRAKKSAKTINGLEARINDLEAAATAREAADEAARMIQEVADETGVPADAIRGATADEARAHALLLKDLIDPKPKGPRVREAHKTPDQPADPQREFVRRLLGRD